MKKSQSSTKTLKIKDYEKVSKEKRILNLGGIGIENSKLKKIVLPLHKWINTFISIQNSLQVLEEHPQTQ